MKDWEKLVRLLSDDQKELLSRWTENALSSMGSPDSTESLKPSRLIAFVVGRDGLANTDPNELKNFLSERLPEFMVPELVSRVESIPRLPNGKVDVRRLQTMECQPVEQGSAFVPPRSEAEKTMAKIWSQLLNVEELSVHDNFFELGGDSIISIQLVSRVREAGLNIDPKHLADFPTIAGLASVALNSKTNRVEEQQRSSGQSSPTPIQLWFLSRELENPNQWNQSKLFEIADQRFLKVLKPAAKYCLEYHDGLRARFGFQNGSWIQRIVASSDSANDDFFSEAFRVVDASAMTEQDLEKSIDQWHACFDLASGPLIRFVLFQNFLETNRLLIIAHHLVIDHVSWSVLIEDFEKTILNLQSGIQPLLPEKSNTLIGWSETVCEYAKSKLCQESGQFWLTAPGNYELPVDLKAANAIDESSVETVEVSLDAAQLTQANEAYLTRTRDLLLAGFTLVLAEWCNYDQIRIDLEGHGREALPDEMDATRLVGWLTSFFPVTFDLADKRGADGDSDGQTIKTVKEQLRSVPNNGLNYGVIRYLTDTPTAKKLRQIPPAQVLFNFMGNRSFAESESSNRQLRPINRNDLGARAKKNLRSHFLEVNAAVSAGRLISSWTFSNRVHYRSTIENLAEQFQTTLERLIEHCLSKNERDFTPSDFPESGLNQNELDQFFDGLE